jgi:hypothetical protein
MTTKHDDTGLLGSSQQRKVSKGTVRGETKGVGKTPASWQDKNGASDGGISERSLRTVCVLETGTLSAASRLWAQIGVALSHHSPHAEVLCGDCPVSGPGP